MDQTVSGLTVPSRQSSCRDGDAGRLSGVDYHNIPGTVRYNVRECQTLEMPTSAHQAKEIGVRSRQVNTVQDQVAYRRQASHSSRVKKSRARTHRVSCWVHSCCAGRSSAKKRTSYGNRMASADSFQHKGWRKKQVKAMPIRIGETNEPDGGATGGKGWKLVSPSRFRLRGGKPASLPVYADGFYLLMDFPARGRGYSARRAKLCRKVNGRHIFWTVPGSLRRLSSPSGAPEEDRGPGRKDAGFPEPP